MGVIRKEGEVVLVVGMVFEWEVDEWMGVEVLVLVVYGELVEVLVEVKEIVDFFVCFVECF